MLRKFVQSIADLRPVWAQVLVIFTFAAIAVAAVLGPWMAYELVTKEREDEPDSLEIALSTGDFPEAKRLLDSGADPNESRRDLSRLTTAAAERNPEAVQLLIRSGAVVTGDADDGDGWALMMEPEYDTNLEPLAPTTEFRNSVATMARLLLKIGYSPCASVAEKPAPSAQLDELFAGTEPELIAQVERRERACA